MSTMNEIVSIDTETHLIATGNLAPPLVSLSVSYLKENRICSELSCIAEKEHLYNTLCSLLNPENHIHIVGANLCFDLTVIIYQFPELTSWIFQKAGNWEFHDVQIREMLINLSLHGGIDFIELDNGSTKAISYSLSELEKSYLGVDRTREKEDPDAPRFNYQSLQDTPLKDWPEEYKKYAIEDSENTLKIFFEQEKQRDAASLASEEFQTSSSLCLRLMTCLGLRIDQSKVQEIEREVALDLNPEKMGILVESGILRPAEPGRPKKKQPKEAFITGNTVYTKGTEESIDTKKLKKHVEKLCESLGKEVKKTETKRTSLNEEVITSLLEEVDDPILVAYKLRQSLQKIVNTYLPAISGHDIIYPNFSVLKVTGRTGSSGNRKGKNDYPSTNIQNQDPRIRPCFIPSPGHLFCSIDFSAAELVTTAQTVFGLFGHSKLRDVLLAGRDPHAYLGSQLARNLDTQFAHYCNTEHLTLDQVYDVFIKLKEGTPEAKEFFKKYRSFAKPTGLGYPGGLGPKTFVEFAKRDYGISIDVETAETLRNIWFETYPEMREYLHCISSNCRDPLHSEKFWYQGPLGIVRTNCVYTECANGMALQTPAAMGGKFSLISLSRACYDASVGSALYGQVKILAFIHDEFLLEVPEKENTSELVKEAQKIMEESFTVVACKDVGIKTEASLMRRWDKKAEPVFNSKGDLIVWEP